MKRSGAAAIVMNLSYKGQTEEISMLGGKNMIGQPVKTTIEGAEFTISYGSQSHRNTLLHYAEGFPAGKVSRVHEPFFFCKRSNSA